MNDPYLRIVNRKATQKDLKYKLATDPDELKSEREQFLLRRSK